MIIFIIIFERNPMSIGYYFRYHYVYTFCVNQRLLLITNLTTVTKLKSSGVACMACPKLRKFKA